MLSAVDWMLLGVVALSALMGAMRGIVVEVLSLVVWIAAFWLAFGYGAEVAGLFFAQMHDPAARLLAAYAAVFIAALIVGSLVTWLVGKLVRTVGLGGIDRLLGLLFGVVRGCALACVLVLLLGMTALPREASWHASPLIPQFQRGAEWMKDWLPASAAQHVNFEAVVEQGRKKVVQTLEERVLQEASPAVPQGEISPGDDSQHGQEPVKPASNRHGRH
jgi:membrane protein required for colicin V production